jgi:hypothetical protein
MLYLFFSTVCTIWVKLPALWMLAVKTHSFICSRIQVPLVGAEWCVYRMLGSGTFRAAVIGSVYV